MAFATDFADAGRDMGDAAVLHAINGAKPPEKPSLISATPYVWRDPATLPLRPWLYGRWFLRGTVACVIAPGGVGKSTLLAGVALSMVTGRPLLGKQVWEGPKRVWLWNLEDDMNELSRAIQASAKHFNLKPVDVERLFVDSGMEGSTLCTAIETEGQFRLLEPVYEALLAELRTRKIDVLIIDPLVSSHEVEENANSKIDKITKAWGRVAKGANCVIILVHHTSKAGAAEVTAMSARGAKALTDGARTTLVINRMEPSEAERLGIDEEDRRRYISVADDKHNRTLPEKADWFRLASVDLGNGPQDGLLPGDSVGVAEPWCVPDPFADITVSHLAAVQDEVASHTWREDYRAGAWVGIAVANVLGLDVENKNHKARIKMLLKTWIAEGALKVTEGTEADTRQKKKFVEVGRRVNAAATVRNTVASQSVAPSQKAATLQSSPYRGGTVASVASGDEEVSHPLSRTVDFSRWEKGE